MKLRDIVHRYTNSGKGTLRDSILRWTDSKKKR